MAYELHHTQARRPHAIAASPATIARTHRPHHQTPSPRHLPRLTHAGTKLHAAPGGRDARRSHISRDHTESAFQGLFQGQTLGKAVGKLLGTYGLRRQKPGGRDKNAPT